MPFIDNLSITDYHQSNSVSKSKLVTFLKDGPLAFHLNYNTKSIQRKSTKALQFGTQFDDMIFDCLGFHSRYSIKPPGCDLRKPSYAAWAKEQNGRTLIDHDDYQMMMIMKDAMAANDLFREHLAVGSPQVTIRRDLPDLNLSLQSRPDWLNLQGGYALDLKTTNDMDQFPKQVIQYGYVIQACIGRWLLAREGHQCDWILGVVEKTEAPRARLFRIPEDALAATWDLVKNTMTDISQRYARGGDWLDHQTEITDLVLPAWQLRELEKQAYDG